MAFFPLVDGTAFRSAVDGGITDVSRLPDRAIQTSAVDAQIHRMRTAMVLCAIEQSLGEFVVARNATIPAALHAEVIERYRKHHERESAVCDTLAALVPEMYLTELLDLALGATEGQSENDHVLLLHGAAKTAGIPEIRNAVAHPNRPFVKAYWYRVAALASHPAVLALGFNRVLQALESAESNQITLPPSGWFDQQEWCVSNNLPATLDHEITGLVGRKNEAKELLKSLKTARFPLIGLVGPGGVGKTALLLEVLRGILLDTQAAAWVDQILYLSAKTQELTAEGVETLVSPIKSLQDLEVAIGRGLNPTAVDRGLDFRSFGNWRGSICERR
jgi:Arc/MetJ family transcription regulator